MVRRVALRKKTGRPGAKSTAAGWVMALTSLCGIRW
jgi:hypothetical protein